jgi:transaldolase
VKRQELFEASRIVRKTERKFRKPKKRKKKKKIQIDKTASIIIIIIIIMASENALEQLKRFTKVVADTGEFDLIEEYKPQDSTTNPSLILKAMQANNAAYDALVDEAVAYAKGEAGRDLETLEERVQLAADKVFVNFGVAILKLIPGRVSTEVDARLSFDTEATLKRARRIAAMYREAGVDVEKRLLIKIASTWEGLAAAKVLENDDGLHVNMTLLFAVCQARVAGEVGATLISPFVGRITDFYKTKLGVDGFDAASDPGVHKVSEIYALIDRRFNSVEVMGASFRNKEQVLALAGCPLLTISPALLRELAATEGFELERALVPDERGNDTPPAPHLTEAEFRCELNADECAQVKLGDGIRRFVADQEKLEALLKAKFDK